MEFSIATLLANFSDDKLVAPKALEKKLDCQDDESQYKFQIILDALERIGVLTKDKGRYRRVYDESVVEAKLRCSSKGFCFAIQDSEGSEDVYIRASHLNHAWNGDRVLVKIIKEGSRRRSPEGEVQLILERANPSVLARVKQVVDPGMGLVSYRAVPLDDRLLFEMDLINQERELIPAIDYLVHVEVLRYPLGTHRPIGRVVQILGSDAEAADDLDIVCCKHDLPRSFPKGVLEVAESLPHKLKKTDLKNRLDLRKLLTLAFTPEINPQPPAPLQSDPSIKPKDVKTGEPLPPMIERAITLETTDAGYWQLGVHVTDIAHYVLADSPLDREARKRGIAVFLGETAISIWPEAISRNICSLLPGQERLTLSVLLTLDQAGNLVEFEIRPSVIQVDYQMSYEQVENILDSDDESVHPELDQLFAISQVVKRSRQRRGSFELNSPDTHCHFDDEGELGAMIDSSFSPAQSMIAELMVLANAAVASHIQALGVPGIYRVQGTPDAADVQELSKLASNLGVDLVPEDEEEIQTTDFQRFTESFANSKSERVLTYLLEDTLKPAVYSAVSKPHFGLGLDSYIHFTAPLSRYSDLLNQRVLYEVFNHGRDRRTSRAKEGVDLHHSDCHDKINWNVLPSEVQGELENQITHLVVHLSERESVAQDAEDDLEGLKKTGLMKERISQVFQGLITGVQSYGFFVEIEVTSPEGQTLRVEGLVHVSSLKDDWYEYRSRQQTLVGRKNRNQYRLGDRVDVQVKSVDYYRQQIDLVAVGGGSEASDDGDESFRY